jgi:beta-glucosidase/6-phospho-beta-glucosidase/beta-galactosidase
MQTPFDWLNVYPQGMKKTINYVKERYNNTPMFITENGKQRTKLKFEPFSLSFLTFWVSNWLYPNVLVGYGNLYDPDNTIEEHLHDIKRVNYMSGHLDNLMASIR